MRFFQFAAAVISMALAINACAQQKDATGTYIWYDSGKLRQLHIDTTLVAEFISRADIGTAPILRDNGVYIWRKQDMSLGRGGLIGPASPVFRDSQGGAMRALPGNVIVRLDPSWSVQQVTAWLNENELTELRRLPMGKNILVLVSPPGLPALELANRLQQSGKIVSAQPEWWEQRSNR